MAEKSKDKKGARPTMPSIFVVFNLNSISVDIEEWPYINGRQLDLAFTAIQRELDRLRVESIHETRNMEKANG